MPKKGEKHSPETIRKIKEARKGIPPWNVGEEWPDVIKVKMGISRRHTFDWIENDSLRELIIRDFAVAKMCEERQLFKPAIILYAAVIEALLRYKLRERGLVTFVGLIEKASACKLIGDSLRAKLDVLRDFRNYVHIHKELRSEFKLTEGLTQLSREICDAVIKRLREH